MYDKLAVSGGTTVTYLGDNTSYLLSELVKTNTNSTSESNRYGVAYNLGNFNADNRIFAENGYQFQGGSNVDKVNELPWYKAVYNKTANQWTIYASLPAQTFLNASGGTWIYDGTAKEATATLTGEDTDKYTIEYK